MYALDPYGVYVIDPEGAWTEVLGVPWQAAGGEERDEALAPARERAEDEGG